MRVLVVLLLVCHALSSSAAPIDSVVTEEKPKQEDTSGFKMSVSPMLALGLSAVVPGAGQVYVGDWYKAPFILGGIVGCFYAAAIQNDRYHYTADSVTNQLARGDTYNAGRYASVREFYRDDRDKWYIYAALIYVANLIDAYIAAHLFDFDVSDPTPAAYLSAPASEEAPWRLGIHLRF